MAFRLDGVVPWGRNLEEYRRMFLLDDRDMKKKIAGFGDGPASFNCEAAQRGGSVTSFDPVYRFSREDLEKRIEEVRGIVMRQVRENMDHYVWTQMKNPEELEEIRMSAMRLFLSDYEQGKAQKRYICHELPERLPCGDGTFDIGLSSHFLLMYTGLGYDFHIRAMTEMLRVCREIRIFPIVDLNAEQADMIAEVIDFFRKDHDVEIKKTSYEFQKGGDKLLIIRSGKTDRGISGGTGKGT